MAVVAEHHARAGPHGSVRLLEPPAQRSLREGDDALLLGFPASPEREPWSRLAPARRRELTRAAARGEATPAGTWTLLARDGDELVVRGDRWGTRPLFHRAGGGVTRFADEIWSLLDRGHPLDPVGVADFLVLGHGLGERTLFAGVRSTQPDALLRVGAPGVRRSFGRPAPPRPLEGGLDDAAAALEQQLAGLLAPYLDVERMLVGLSGGLDSRVILALCVEAGIDVHAWTFALLPGSVEEQLARRVARELGVEHTVTVVEPGDLPERARDFVRGSSAQVSVEHAHAHGAHRLAPARYAVTPSGTFGDVLCGDSFLLPDGLSAGEVERLHLERLLAGRDAAALAARLPGVAGWEERVRGLVAEWFAALGRDPAQADLLWTRNRTGRFNVHPIAAARDRLDYVLPFLDEQLAAATCGLPFAARHRSEAYRRAIARRWPRLAKIPWAATGLPLRRFPNRLDHRRRALAARLRPRPAFFTDPGVYERALAELAREAQASLRGPLGELGIDLDGLLADHPEGGAHGGSLRLRLATLRLALDEAGAAAGEPAATAATR